MNSFTGKIYKIGINPYVLPPQQILDALFVRAGKAKSPIPVKGKLQGIPYTQTLVKYAGKWRLYLNTPMRRNGGVDVGDVAIVSIEYDPVQRDIPLHPALKKTFAQHKKAKQVFEQLTPYRQKEILRYFNNLKTEAAISKNLTKLLAHLLHLQKFAGRLP